MPLVEAAALGHPWPGPRHRRPSGVHAVGLRQPDAARLQVRAYAEDPVLLRAHGDLCYRYVRSGMRWSFTAAALVDVIAEARDSR